VRLAQEWLLLGALSSMANIQEQLESLVLSATEVKGLTNWPDAMVEDYLNIIRNLIIIASSTDINVNQIEQNTQDIAQNSVNINQNRNDIDANTQDIEDLETEVNAILSQYLKSASESDGVVTITDQDDNTLTFLAEPQIIALEMTVSQSVDSTTFTPIQFDSYIKDSSFSHSNGSTAITAVNDGIYRINGFISVDGSTSNYRYTGESRVTINGVPSARSITSGYIRAAGGSNESAISVGDTLSLSAGDVLEIEIAKVNSVAGNATTTIGKTWIEITRIR